MSLTFTQTVLINDILALKDFSIFLFNFALHEKPSWLHRRIIKAAEIWISLRARKEFIELRAGLKEMDLTLKDCKTSIFAVLFLAQKKEETYGSGKELFTAINHAELEFEKVKNPRDEAVYQGVEL